MKEIKIAKYSAYISGSIAPYSDFRKMYKGVKVYVAKYDGCLNFKIVTRTLKASLWKTPCENMRYLIFNDGNLSITCDFENVPKNKSQHTLSFEKEVYDELKENIPAFLKECGVEFTESADDARKLLEF